MSVRGIGWYTAAFLALIGSAAALGFFGLSFFSSFTPLYVSILCSIVAIGCGVAAAILARPAVGRADAGGEPDEDAGAPDEEASRRDEETHPAEATRSGDAE